MSPADKILDVVIVGAGPAGLGLAVMLQNLGVQRVGILERERVGASLRRWPRETRFITPSFYGNPFGLPDLNTVTPTTSPADLIGIEHPSGEDYAHYLTALVAHHRLQVAETCAVNALIPLGPRAEGFFQLDTSRGKLIARHVVWAAGEFGSPDYQPFPGATRCRHYADIRSFAELPGEERLVIGGFESALDAACHLVAAGKTVRVLSPRATWELPEASDPSVILTPYTRQRVLAARATGRLDLVSGVRVTRVDFDDVSQSHLVVTDDGRTWPARFPPILGTGFIKGGGARQIAPLFEWTDTGFPLLTADDESTLTPGLFLVGPHVRHDKIIFCFIYKFRQRFAVVARALATRLDLDPTPLEKLRAKGFFLDDLSCCLATCEC
jgi:cation diffusion facilitator CzcD-associated flavoprotein CzcO